MGGPGIGAGGRAPERASRTGFDKTRVRGPNNKGVIAGAFTTSGEPPKGKAMTEYAEVQQSFAEEVNNVLTRQKIPASRREYVREYFDAIKASEEK